MEWFNPELKLSSATYDETAYLNAQRLDASRMVVGSELSEMLNSAVVYGYGSDSEFGAQNFPILFATQGQGKKRAIKSVDGSYFGKVFGKPKKTSQVSKSLYTLADRPGLNGADIVIPFVDGFFQKNQIIYTGGLGGPQIQIRSIVKGAFGHHAIGKLFGNKGYVHPKYLQQGAVWSAGVIKVSIEDSRGTENRSYTPYKITNQLSRIRQSINVKGNAANKMLNVDLKIKGQKFRFYYEFDKYMTELAWMEQKELDLITSKYNRDANGITVNYDADSDKPVYSGMGIWDQIPSSNIMRYPKMTESRLSSFITDTLSITGQLRSVGQGTRYVDVMCGFGLLEEINEALKRNMSLLTPMPSSELFVSKNTSGGLTIGSYFTEYRHISGVIFRFTHHPAFDSSALADSADKHPVTLRPITSYYGFIANFTNVEVDKAMSATGVAGNIEYVYEDGVEYVEGTVRGLAKIEGQQGGNMATDRDASSLEMMCSQGIHCHYPMSLGAFVCNIS